VKHKLVRQRHLDRAPATPTWIALRTSAWTWTAAAFAEDAWIGRRLRIGDTVVLPLVTVSTTRED